jgi:hypothetical protein
MTGQIRVPARTHGDARGRPNCRPPRRRLSILRGAHVGRFEIWFRKQSTTWHRRVYGTTRQALARREPVEARRRTGGRSFGEDADSRSPRGSRKQIHSAGRKQKHFGRAVEASAREADGVYPRGFQSHRRRCCCCILNAAVPRSTSSASWLRHYGAGGPHQACSVPRMSHGVSYWPTRCGNPQICAAGIWRSRK